MLNGQIAQKVMAKISLRHQNAITIANKNTAIARSNLEYIEKDKLCRQLVLTIAQEKSAGKSTFQLEEQFRDILVSRNNVLQKLNLTQQDLLPKYTCDLCEDTGYVNGKPCKCFVKMYNQLLMQQSGLDFNKIPAIKDYDFSVFEGDNLINAKKILNVADVYVNNFSELKIKNMLLIGSVGVGKTYLSKIIAKEVFQKNYSVLFSSAFSLFNSFSDIMFKAQEKAKFLEYLTEIDLLVIDDLGAQNANKMLLQDLLALINERVENKKSTIITTNLNPIDIKNNFGERLFSRLNDKREFFVVNLRGKDLRLN